MSEIRLEQTKCRLQCLVVDDESIAVEGVVNYIEKINFLEVAYTCSSAIEAAEILRNNKIDLMFLDINMPQISGLDFLESLHNPPFTILTTAYSEYALDGFRLHIVDYLLKPFSFLRFLQAAERVLELFQTRTLLNENVSEKSIDMYIRQGDSFKKIYWTEILFVETMQNYLKLHFKDKTLIIHQTMTSLEKILPQDSFFRIHKSFLVNTSYIESIDGGSLFINGESLPLSKHRKKELLDKIVYKKLISK